MPGSRIIITTLLMAVREALAMRRPEVLDDWKNDTIGGQG